jgi:hypothetical protein
MELLTAILCGMEHRSSAQHPHSGVFKQAGRTLEWQLASRWR